MRKFFNHEHSVSISPSTIVFAVFLVIGLYFFYYIREIVVTFFMALIVMSALSPSLRWMRRKLHIPKSIGIVILYLLLISIIVAAFGLIVPPLFSEVPNLINSLHLPPLPPNIRNFNFTIVEANQLINQFQSSFGTIFDILMSTFNGIFTFLTIIVLSAYLLLDRDNLHKRVMWFSRDPKHVALAKDFVDSLEVQLGGWVSGQLLLMLTIGILTFVSLTILKVPYALPLALATSFLEILPNLGPTLSAIPALMVAYSSGGWSMTGVVLVLFLVIQQLENNIIVPRIMKANVDVSPLMTILVILTGFKIGGVIGALMSVPTYIVIRMIYAFWMRDNGEEDQSVKVSETLT